MPQGNLTIERICTLHYGYRRIAGQKLTSLVKYVGQRGEGIDSIQFASSCRPPNGFWNDARLSGNFQPLRAHWLRSIRHSPAAYSASRNMRRRSLARKRIRLSRSYG
jgi:hypothetical protein